MLDEMPSDFRLLVPRDWFRVDLLGTKWRHSLGIFKDRYLSNGRISEKVASELWLEMCWVAEKAIRNGGIEYYIRVGEDDDVVLGSSLVVSILPARDGSLKQVLQNQQEASMDGQTVAVVKTAAGPAVEVFGNGQCQRFVGLPGGDAFLLLAFSMPFSSSIDPQYELCSAISDSLRWF